MKNNENNEIDAVTSATVRAVGKTADGSGHTILKLSGLASQDDVNRVAQAIFDVDGVVAVKVFDSLDKAMYDVEKATPVEAVITALAALNITASLTN